VGDVNPNAPVNLGEGAPLYLPGPEVEGDPSRWDLCGRACPTCHRFTIGQIDAMSCRDCASKLGALAQGALDDVRSIPQFDKAIDIVPAKVEGDARA
jgi:hypothetical protein